MRIKELRNKAGFSQKDLAERLGMHMTTYVRYETGVRELPLSAAVMLADIYRVSLDYLVGRSDENLWAAKK